jgi:hypothetical protein
MIRSPGKNEERATLPKLLLPKFVIGYGETAGGSAGTLARLSSVCNSWMRFSSALIMGVLDLRFKSLGDGLYLNTTVCELMVSAEEGHLKPQHHRVKIFASHTQTQRQPVHKSMPVTD